MTSAVEGVRCVEDVFGGGEFYVVEGEEECTELKDKDGMLLEGEAMDCCVVLRVGVCVLIFSPHRYPNAP